MLIAITLLAFVVALLVGLAGYTQIETAVTGHSQRQAQARENALLALNMALGQLQKYAGPDLRVTASAGSSVHLDGTEHYTGVWDSRTNAFEPLTWLVSGNDGFGPDGAAQPLAVTPAAPGSPLMELAGRSSSGGAAVVRAPLRELRMSGVPGTNSRATVGRYAWWVGDDGLKAAITGPDRLRPVHYVPYHTPELRARRWQQASRGAAPPDFEPLAEANVALTRNLIARNQLAFLHTPDGSPVGFDRLREQVHAWSAGNFAVLANTRTGGLRTDLSSAPEVLGSAFAAWTDYLKYMEPPDVTGQSAPMPPYGQNPLRRRYRIVPPNAADGFTFSTAPVLTLVFLQFNIRRVGGNNAPAATRELEVRARLVCQLWNPWTAALVPEDLRLDVDGLPTVTITDSHGGNQKLDLQRLFGVGQMSIRLTAADVAFGGDSDDRSWLPGRVYYWRTKGGTRDQWETEFYNRSLAVPNTNVWTVPAGLAYQPPATNSVTLRIAGPRSRIVFTLRRASDGAKLASYRGPEFEAFATEPRAVNSNDEFRIGFPVRMVESTDFAALEDGEGWLQVAGSDPRALHVGEPMLRALSAGARPDQYVGVGGSAVFTDPDRLLDRVMGKSGMSYNEDVPLFELPRSPVLSLGCLQHIQVEGGRPFAIGNPWGGMIPWGNASINAVFDAYFFSGLSAEVDDPDVTQGVPLPNTLLRIIPRRPDGGATTARDLRAQLANGYSSKHLLQGGAFNLNALEPRAWIALLRSGRFLGDEEFRYLDASATSGSAGDDAVAATHLSGAVFFRFPQSAQETYKAEPGYAASTAASPAPPLIASAANTHLFRRGIRTLTEGQVVSLASAIVRGLRRKHTESGPFRSLEEFLNASPIFGDAAGRPRGLLEAAIAEAGLNAHVPEFSSQFLTPADLMTLLAPVLFARSDTFTIRAYGETVNPATAAAEGRAWCEATVQRVPEYFDPAQPADTASEELNQLNQLYGRRIKVVTFRWLTRADI